MSNLDHLIAKVLDDCEEKAKRIIEDANGEASKIIQKSVDAAEKEKEKILSDAEVEAEKTAERILSEKRLEIRDENLNVKMEAINKVFDLALQKLNDMKKEEYQAFLSKQLLSLDCDGGELILPSKYNIASAEELRAFLRNHEKTFHLNIHDGERTIDGGFILIKDGVEYNYTFESLLQYQRYALESEIIKILF